MNDQVMARRRIFVAMPFSADFDDVYHLGIKQACDKIGATCIRVDEQIFEGGILERIYREIDSSDLVIGEMSVHNPNVYYEIGYATGRRKKVVLIARTAANIPFDFRNLPHVLYGGSINKLGGELVEHIEALLASTSDLGPREIGGLWTGVVRAEHHNPRFPEVAIRMEFRWAGRVEGFAVLEAGEHSVRLKFVGDFKYDRYLMLTYEADTQSMMQFGAAILCLNGVGDQLEGRYAGYGAIHDTIVYGGVTLVRQSRSLSK
jgi:hypothetical protein